MKLSIKNFVLLILMLASAGMASTLRPTIRIADQLAPINLAEMVPTAFGDWQELPTLTNQIVNPQQQATLEKIYSETLSRTYINAAGYRIMLSIAYGKDQSDALQLHKPEVCYPAQGFKLLTKRSGALDVLDRPVSAVQLETSLEQRFEPITYWTVVGDQVTTSGLNKKITEMHYALNGKIPDGMLVRISSIDKNTIAAYTLQAQFAHLLAQALPLEHRSRFIGNDLAK